MAGKHFEVERKYRISPDEFANLPIKLSERGFSFVEKVSMTDTFLPATGEGSILRLRRESAGCEVRNILTRKEWVYLAGGEKERQEQEERVGELVSQVLVSLGKAASNEPLLSYGKDRFLYQGVLDGYKIIVSLDCVEGLAEYSGNYMEVEILVAGDEGVESARNLVFKFAQELLGDSRDFEPLSYKAMLERALQRAGV